MKKKPDFQLYAYWRTSATYRVRVALNLKGLQAEETIVNLDSGEQREVEFLKINPLGAIPALVDCRSETVHEPITQSLAILEFLDETYPSTPLLPTGAHARARVRSLCNMLVADTHPLFTPRVKKYLTTTGKFDDAMWKAWQTQWFSTGLQAFEKRLVSDAHTGTFCHGNEVTMADICLASILVVMRVFKIEVGGIPTINQIMTRCEALKAFADAAPSRQVGAPSV
jgi:maleylacetoacetate isomerase